MGPIVLNIRARIWINVIRAAERTGFLIIAERSKESLRKEVARDNREWWPEVEA